MADESTAALKARSHIVAEIRSSERAYCDFLAVLQEVYDVPLKNSVGGKRPLMAPEDVALLFGLLPPIYAGCLEFQRKLESVLSAAAWDSHTTLLSPVFLESEAYFQAYSPYVNRFGDIQVCACDRETERKRERERLCCMLTPAPDHAAATARQAR